jgi:hypothetical protein
MSNRSYPPPYLRYLKVRLFIFRQPALWGISIFCLLIGILTWEYWLKPNYFAEQQNYPVIAEKQIVKPDISISDEDKNIAADIDNLPVLLKDFEQVPLSETASLSDSQTTSVPGKNELFLEDVINKNNADTQSKNTQNIAQNLTPAMEKNPFVTESENLLQSRRNDNYTQVISTSTVNTGTETTSSNTVSLNSQNPRNKRNILINPLETAINQSSNFTNGINTSIPVTNSLPPQVSLPSNSMGYIEPTITNQQPNPYQNNSVQTSQPIIVPASIVSRVNSAIQNNGYPVQSTNPAVVNSSTPVGYAIGYGNYNGYPVQSTNPAVVNSSTPVGYGNYNGYALQLLNQSTPSNMSYPVQVQGQYPSGYRN